LEKKSTPPRNPARRDWRGAHVRARKSKRGLEKKEKDQLQETRPRRAGWIVPEKPGVRREHKGKRSVKKRVAEEKTEP